MTIVRRIADPWADVPRDPISAIVGLSSLFSFGSLTVLGIPLTTVLGVGALVGLSYAAQAFRGQGAANSAGGLNDNSIRYNERQAIPPKRIIYGTAQVGGPLFFEVVKPPYLYHGFLICAEQINGFRKMWVGSNEINFGSLGPNQTLTPIPVDGQPDYPNNLKVSFRLGSPSQTMDGLLQSDFASLDSTFRQQGIATAVVRYNYGSNYDAFVKLWGQVQKPNPLWLVDGISIPDPRKAGHILNWNPDDPDSLAEARASWSFSNNATLVRAHYLTQKYGGIINPSRIDWDKVAKSADFDDDMIPCKDGTFQRRYTIDGVVTMNQGRSDVMNGFLAANRGFILQEGGRSWPSAAFPRVPVATITDKDLTGAISIRSAKPKKDLINRVKTRMVAPDQEYQKVDGPILSRTDLQTIDGEILDGTLDLPFTIDDRRAQRLAKAYLESGRLGRQISARLDVSFLARCNDSLVGSTVNWDSKLFPQGNGVFFVTEWGFSDGFAAIDVSLTEYDPSIENDWNAATDEQAFEFADLDVS